jgi:periplasmic protein TonB
MNTLDGGEERLKISFMCAAVLHAAFIGLVHFEAPDPPPDSMLPTIDVTLVNVRSPKAPDKADFLAQANQQGGGESDTVQRPRAPISGPKPRLIDGIAPRQTEVGAPTPATASPDRLVASLAPSAKVTNLKPEQRRDTDQLPPSSELIQRHLEMARLQAEIGESLNAYAKRPKRKFISANTKEYVYAQYMQNWVARVERIGNINYPEKARADNLNGNVVLTVAIRRNGTLDSVSVIDSSGIRLLDEAAQSIVKLAAPYQPLPDAEKDVDVLHITRTWQFLPGNVLRHK